MLVMQIKNYYFFPGWQTRWFILENGVLTYYKSQEEVNQGCKGSIKVQACEINGNILVFFSSLNR